MQTVSQTRQFTKGGVLLRDGFTFAVLCLVTAALFGLTLFLFRTFEGHRSNLGDQWSARGRAALKDGKPEEAVEAFRTALTFSPNDRNDQLLLAQALAASGRIDEATNYFLNLWEARPGDGFLNVQLARLLRKKGDKAGAVNYYRAAIFGSWEGDGVQRRRETRLELADYLASQGDPTNARREILIAAGNAPEREDLELAFGDKLRAIGDTADALTYYEKAIQDDPVRETALERAGRAAYALGKYGDAAALLTRAVTKAKKKNDANKLAELTALVTNSQRLVALNPSRELPAVERTEHLEAARAIAQKRMQGCVAQLSGAASGQRQDRGAPLPPDMATLRNRWASVARNDGRVALERNAALEDTVMALVFDTERETAHVCGQPEGDDALLLLLARGPSAQ